MTDLFTAADQRKREAELLAHIEHCHVLLANALSAMRGDGGIVKNIIKKQIRETIRKKAA